MVKFSGSRSSRLISCNRAKTLVQNAEVLAKIARHKNKGTLMEGMSAQEDLVPLLTLSKGQMKKLDCAQKA